jgi:DNA-directed RNA polymerase sigma subunit (sigma70/sigma32)
MRKISKEAQELLNQIETQLAKSLPSDEDLKSPLRKKDRGEWADAMLNLMFLMDNIIFLECGYTLEHRLRELGEQSGLTSERMRQVEEKSIRKICQNNSKETLEDLKLAIQELSVSRAKRVTDFASNATLPSAHKAPYQDPNGKAQQQSA